MGRAARKASAAPMARPSRSATCSNARGGWHPARCSSSTRRCRPSATCSRAACAERTEALRPERGPARQLGVAVGRLDLGAGRRTALHLLLRGLPRRDRHRPGGPDRQAPRANSQFVVDPELLAQHTTQIENQEPFRDFRYGYRRPGRQAVLHPHQRRADLRRRAAFPGLPRRGHRRDPGHAGGAATCSSSRATTARPARPTATCSSPNSKAHACPRAARRHQLRRGASSTWTASGASTTRSVTPPATSCCSRWRNACAACCARATSWRAWAATSLSSFSTARPTSARSPGRAQAARPLSASRCPLAGRNVWITGSCGIAMFPPTAETRRPC